MDKTKNVFISHFNQDDKHIKRLKDLLAKKGYQIKNSSIDSTKPNRIISPGAIERLLQMRIHWAGTVICLIGPKTHTRPWVNWEIEQAHKKNKNIIGIFTHGAANSDIPENLNKYGHNLCTWNSDKIIDAIEGEPSPWCEPDGNKRGSIWDLSRSKC